jgi:hypothetical protein
MAYRVSPGDKAVDAGANHTPSSFVRLRMGWSFSSFFPLYYVVTSQADLDVEGNYIFSKVVVPR